MHVSSYTLLLLTDTIITKHDCDEEPHTAVPFKQCLVLVTLSTSDKITNAPSNHCLGTTTTLKLTNMTTKNYYSVPVTNLVRLLNNNNNEPPSAT